MKELTKEKLDEFEMDMLKHRLCGFNLPTDNEYEIMSMVSYSLNDNQYIINPNFIESDSAIKDGLLSMNIFDNKHLKKLMKIVFYSYGDLSENDFRTMIEFNGKKGKVREVMIPENVTEVAPIWIGHECIHCLKDTNYNEYINKDITSEVLTLFYEMVVANSIFKDVHDVWKKERLNTLIYDKYCYEFAKKRINNNKKSDIYEYIMYSYGQYLTSYYYALNLYSLYKENPKEVINYFNKILNHKKTTFDLLNEFDLQKMDKEHVNTYVFEHNKL